MQLVVGQSPAAGNDTSRNANPCQFSTFKSSPVRTAPEVASLDIAGLNIRPRETNSNHTELGCRKNRVESSVCVGNRLPDKSPNASFRQLDKQSYFFQSYKADKDIDFDAMISFDRVIRDEKKVDHGDDVAASGSLNCFGGLEKDKGVDHDDRKQKGSMLGGGRHHDTRRDSGNVEFLEKEGEIFKISSSELLQETSGRKKRNFSFNNKEKTHKSLESLERSIDMSAKDSKSLDLLFEEAQLKAFYQRKQWNLDSSQRSKNSVDSSASKARKRPNFFQRVRRSWHFLLMQRRIRRRNKYERPLGNREKCEYFLCRLHKNDFHGHASSLPVSRSPCESDLDISRQCEPDVSANKEDELISNDQKDQKEVTVPSEDNSTFRVTDDVTENKTPDEGTNHGTPQQGNDTGKPPLIVENVLIGTEKREQFMGWITIRNLEALSNSTHSNESVCCHILHDTLGTLKGIFFDIFLCICV
ncbi:uncharacterized protein LOC143429405 [Xylocopa sonorina]|uniref:uncharacterized protein LOC143429405 n=1 Tax=Xylocopa sonorina TaxID=1818115 RepID=UPI00403AAC58